MAYSSTLETVQYIITESALYYSFQEDIEIIIILLLSDIN